MSAFSELEVASEGLCPHCGVLPALRDQAAAWRSLEGPPLRTVWPQGIVSKTREAVDWREIERAAYSISAEQLDAAIKRYRESHIGASRGTSRR